MTTRVLVVIDSFSFGGAENLLAVLGNASSSHGIELHVASLVPRARGRNALLHVLEEAGLDISFLDVPRLLYLPAISRIARLIRQTRADVVHAHLGYSAILAPIAARLTGRPVVATLHHVPGQESQRERLKERLAVTIAGRLGLLLFVSEASRSGFAARYRERSRSWQTLHNGVDVTRFSPLRDASFPPDLQLPSSVPVVTVIAALRPPKGHRTAILAWPQVLASVPDARLLIVGEGVEFDSLYRLTVETGVADRVVFAGARQDVPALLQASTLVALPSLTEALPTALIEAAACGKAVVATRVGGVPEVVEHGRTGLLVPPADVAAFGGAVVELLLDPACRARMETEARVIAEERFDAHAWARRLSEIYAKLL